MKMDKVHPDESIVTDNSYRCNICSIKLSVAFIIVLLSIGIVVVATMMSTVNIVSLIGMKERIQDSTLSLMIGIVENQMTHPMLLTESVAATASSKSLTEYSFTAKRDYLYSTFKRAQKLLPKNSVGVSAYTINPPTAIAFGGKISDPAYLHMVSWTNVTKPGMQQFYFLPSVMEPAQANYSKYTVALPFFLANARMINASLDGISKWLPTTNECYEKQDGTLSCTIQLFYLSPAIDSETKLVTGFSMYGATTAVLSEEMKHFASRLPGSTAFVIEKRTSNVLASSDTTAKIFEKVGGKIIPIKCQNVHHDLISTTCKKLHSEYGEKFETIKGSASLNAIHQASKERVYIDYATYEARGLEWIIVVSIPQHKFIGKYITGVTVAVIVAICLVTFAGTAGSIAGFAILKPLTKLVSQIQLVETMRLEEVCYDYSVFTEISNMQRSFYIVVSRLKEYKAFLPASIVNRDYGIDEETVSDFAEEEPLKVLDKTVSLNNVMENSISIISSHDKKDTVTKLALGLSYENGIVMVCSIKNFDDLFATLGTDFIPFYESIVNELAIICKRTKGNIVSFSEEEFVITWSSNNAHRYNMASRCALLLRDVLNKQIRAVHSESSVCIGLVEGGMYSGNMGTSSQRVYRVFGSAMRTAKVLSTVSKTWGIEIVVSQSMFSQCCNSYLCRQISELNKLGSRNHPDLDIQVTKIYEIVDKLTNSQDEWMYQMEKEKQVEKYGLFQQAYQLMEAKLYAEARDIFLQFHSENPDDFVSRELHKYCSDQAAHNDPQSSKPECIFRPETSQFQISFQPHVS